jgi:hypothetical protein
MLDSLNQDRCMRYSCHISNLPGQLLQSSPHVLTCNMIIYLLDAYESLNAIRQLIIVLLQLTWLIQVLSVLLLLVMKSLLYLSPVSTTSLTHRPIASTLSYKHAGAFGTYWMCCNYINTHKWVYIHFLNNYNVLEYIYSLRSILPFANTDVCV